MSFEWTRENYKEAERLMGVYPQTQSALLPLLHLAQKQNDGWLSRDAMEYVASFLGVTPLHVHSVAHFYTLFNTKPVGKYHIQVCTTVPCYLCAGEGVLNAFTEHLGIKAGETTADNMFTLSEVECLGACTQAVAVQINEEYYENITPESVPDVIQKLKATTKATT